MVMSPDKSPTGQSRLVLVADDEPAIGLLITRMLRPLGFAALVVSNGEAAVSAAMTHAADLACAILDVQMPVMNGVDAAYAIQNHLPILEIVLMSGNIPAALRKRVRQLRLASFLPKPFTCAELHTVIQAAT